jgi:Ca2+/Na+ antiporter
MTLVYTVATMSLGTIVAFDSIVVFISLVALLTSSSLMWFIYLFVVYLTTLFSVTQDYVAPNKRIISERRTGKESEASCLGTI